MLGFYLKGFFKLFAITKKIVLVLLVFLTIISLFAYFIKQDKKNLTSENTDLIKKNREEIYAVLQDPELNKTKEGKLALAVYKMTLCTMVGEGCTDNPQDGDKRFESSIFGKMSKLLALPFSQPPASGISWVYSGLAGSGIIPKAYAAQGIGFAAISPLIPIWRIFRDVSYVLLVLVMVAIGFMIMFRMKLNPQTVISVENSLPKIIISLLLITFSFPIAGFLIDIMYIMIALSISVLVPASKTKLDLALLQNKYLSAGPAVLLDELFPVKGLTSLGPFGDVIKANGFGRLWIDIIGLQNIGKSFYLILPGLLKSLLTLLTGVGGYMVSNLLVDGLKEKGAIWKILDGIGIEAATFGINTGNFISSIFGTISFIFIFVILMTLFGIPFLIGLLVWFTIFLLFFRIFFLLISTYIKIILYIIFAPVVLLFHAIPGRNVFGGWFKNLFGELLTFPLVAVIIMAGNIIINNISLTSGTFWSPPFIYGLNQNALTFLIGLGIILLIPDLIKMVKDMLGIKPLPINIGLGTYFGGTGAAFAGVQGGLGMFTSLYQMPFVGRALMGFARDGKGPLAGVLKNALPMHEGEIFAEELKKRGIGKDT